MPSSEVIINGNTKYEVPDSYMEPLEAYLEMVKEKTLNVVFDAQDDGGPEEGQVHGQGAPTVLDAVKESVPVQNESFAQKLADDVPSEPDPLSASESLDLVERCQVKVSSITFKLASVLQDGPSEMNREKICPLLDSLGNLFDSLERLDNEIRV